MKIWIKNFQVENPQWQEAQSTQKMGSEDVIWHLEFEELSVWKLLNPHSEASILGECS